MTLKRGRERHLLAADEFLTDSGEVHGFFNDFAVPWDRFKVNRCEEGPGVLMTFQFSQQNPEKYKTYMRSAYKPTLHPQIHTENKRMQVVPAEAQVPVVVSCCFGSFYAGRAVWFGCRGGGGVLLGLGGGGGCFLWGAVVAAGGFLFFTRLRLFLAFLGCFCCLFSSTGWWRTIRSLLRFR